jgi:cobalt-zinc-cadmium efflux system outer membrane protein
MSSRHAWCKNCTPTDDPMTPVLTLAALLAVNMPAPIQPFDERSLAAAVWQSAPDVLAARRDLIDAEAIHARTQLLPNPTLTGSWNTIPVGNRPTIDPVTNRPVEFSDVPNYSVGISELFELGKRGPRQRAAAAGRAGSQMTVLDVYLHDFFAVLESLADQAAQTARLAVLQRLVTDSQESLRLQRARADKGDIAPLEVDRLEVEHSRLLSAMHDAQADREGAVVICDGLLGAACPRFAGEEEARRFLSSHGGAPAADSEASLAARPDLQALRAEHDRLEAELTLAGRQSIPDPVASVGFTHDQFVAAGNQPNSLNVTVSIPLPIFDRGQTETTRARRRLSTNQAAVQSLTTGALRGLSAQRAQLQILSARARLLEEQAVPRARSVVERTEAAFRRGGVGFPDVLLARRAFEELELDRIEVAAAAHRASINVRRATADLPWPSDVPRSTRPVPEH